MLHFQTTRVRSHEICDKWQSFCSMLQLHVCFDIVVLYCILFYLIATTAAQRGITLTATTAVLHQRCGGSRGCKTKYYGISSGNRWSELANASRIKSIRTTILRLSRFRSEVTILKLNSRCLWWIIERGWMITTVIPGQQENIRLRTEKQHLCYIIVFTRFTTQESFS